MRRPWWLSTRPGCPTGTAIVVAKPSSTELFPWCCQGVLQLFLHHFHHHFTTGLAGLQASGLGRIQAAESSSGRCLLALKPPLSAQMQPASVSQPRFSVRNVPQKIKFTVPENLRGRGARSGRDPYLGEMCGKEREMYCPLQTVQAIWKR